ncbi:energy-coupling factor ABC transporter permease [Sulfurivermis fontis]|jgi:cobalt/nickel transport system permease protein|uniref:energy-coupling factor ABC transporter permease n=1 Tax=Sulfurivermis fontis TaxID=1972068 RepID=UPI000FDC1F5C|nr:energy-coupling factor ABC transporter permease [Sulfurivermis fontis]
MHIPDGFVAPVVYLPAIALAVPAWALALRRLRSRLRDEAIPRLAVLTALAFVLSTLMIPLPGGTSAHLSGVPLLALLFGVGAAFLAYSVVLVLQLFLFGAGGVTVLALNALLLGLCGAAAARALFRLLVRRHEATAVLVASGGAVLVSAALIALVLGAQPLLAHDAGGQPLFFPFGFSVTLPAVLLPHLAIAAGEAALTWFIWRHARQRGWVTP